MKLKPDTVIPTPDEDAAITAAALSDPDNPPLTDAELAQFRASVHLRAKPVIDALQALGLRVLVDKAEHDLQSTWIDVQDLCVQVHPTNGYGLYVDGDKAYGSKPDEFYEYGQVEALLKRMGGLLGLCFRCGKRLADGGVHTCTPAAP
jgi:hypothetical protein